MFCRTYDFCLLCSCQSSEKKIEKKRILVLFGLSGERYEEAKERGLTLCIFMRKSGEEQDGSVDITIAAIMAERFHLFPFRTQKLSFLTPKVLCGTPLGRIGHRRFSVALLSLKQIEGNFFILYIKTAGVSLSPRFFVDSIQRGGERVRARIVTDKQAKQGMKVCEKRGMESKKVEKDREKLSKTIDKNSLE